MLDKKSSGSILGDYLDTPRTPRESTVDTSESRNLSERRRSSGDIRSTDGRRNSESKQIKKEITPAGSRINEVEALRGVFFSFFMARKSDERDDSQNDRS
jgi:hypothetical protein